MNANRLLLRRLLPPIAIVLLGAAGYANTFEAPFVFDDLIEIVKKPVLRDLDHFVASWVGFDMNPRRFLGYLSFALNHHVGGLDPTGYHVVNLGIHLANALLVYALVLVTFRTPLLSRSSLAPSARAVAFVAAVLFVAHPLQTQAVTYVVQRFAALATTFYLGAIVLYARWRVSQEAGGSQGLRGAGAWAGAVVSAVAAMMTKEIAFTLPFAIVLYEIAFFGRPDRRRILWLAPILATALYVPLTLVRIEQPIGEVIADAAQATRVDTAVSRGDYLITQVAVVATYLRLLVLPVGQSLEHDYPIYRSLLELRVALSALVLVGAAALAAWLYHATSVRRARPPIDPAGRLAAFGILWFFLALSVESSVIPIVDVIFEHRVYLPSVGFFAAVAVGGALAARKLVPARAGPVTVTAGAALGLVLAIATLNRNEVWRDEASVWADVVEKAPRLKRARLNLGEALVRRGDFDAAIPHYLAALEIDPKYAKVRNNLGVAYFEKGMIDESIAQLQIAVALDPAYAEAHNNLGIAYGKKGWFDLARQHMKLGMSLPSRLGGRR